MKRVYAVSIAYQFDKKGKPSFGLHLVLTFALSKEEALDKTLGNFVKENPKSFNYCYDTVLLPDNFVEYAYEQLHPMVPLTLVKE